MSIRLLVILPALASIGLTWATAAEPVELVYVPASTKRVCQLTGDFDRAAGIPTLSQTGNRFGAGATDLGSSFEHKGKLYFLFGDTWGRPGDRDALAWTESVNPAKIMLHFYQANDGKWLPLTVPGISQGAFEVPSGGISISDSMYVVCTTDHSEKKVMGRSVVACSHDDGRTFKLLYELSRTKFINVSFCRADNWLFLYGSGDYRKSSVYLARVKPMDIEDRSKLEYFGGIGPKGQPRWTPQETDAVPLFRDDQIGEFSVSYLNPVQHFAMLYNTAKPHGIILRSAETPWGPWTQGTVIFDPGRDHGYGHFMHISSKNKTRTDALSDPKREAEWGGAYGPYFMSRFTSGADGHCRVYFTMSTWNPYQVMVMQSDLKLDRGRRLLEPFDYRGVTLNTGPLRSQVDEVRAFYLAIPDDDLLKGFRTRARLPAPGKDLGGWYSSDTFLVFGQIVSGLARLHAATGDTACRDKANRLIAEWAKCIESDGYFYASRKPNAPHYIFDKMLWGLLDAHAYCDNQEALGHLERITDWAIRHLERSRRVNDTGTEWYTLSENLYRAFLATGKVKYRDFAEVWEYRAYWDIYARKGDLFAARPDGGRNDSYHAYSHVNTLGGAGAAYLVKGDAYYLNVLRNAYESLRRDQCFATGGYGPDEQLLPKTRILEKLGETHNTFETQCGSWAAFKMAKYLITATGDGQYGDWIERLIINGIGASIPMSPDGRVFYYSDYNLHGGTKQNTDFGWSCCTGTRPQAVADTTDLAYFRDAGSLYVNLFTASTVRWERDGEPVKVTQTTTFPASDEVRLTLSLTKPSEFTIKVRTPDWLAAPIEAKVNGKATTPQVDDRHWTSLHRLWRNGDTISLRLPMKLWRSPLDPRRSTPMALLNGPVVLAFKVPSVKVFRDMDFMALEHNLTPVAGEPLHYRLARNPGVQVQPFASFGAGQRYFVYLDPEMGRRIPHADLTFTGRWNNAGVFRFSNEIGATVEGEFEGTGVRWLGRRFNDAGMAEVSIDGRVVGVVDQFGPGRDLPFDWSHRGLVLGPHKIRIRLLAKKSDVSSNRFLNVAGLEILTDSGH